MDRVSGRCRVIRLYLGFRINVLSHIFNVGIIS